MRLTAELIASLVDRVSGPSRAITGALGRVREAQARNARAMARARGQMMDAVGVGYLLARSLAAPIRAASDFQSAMADINKVVDFQSPDGLKQMSADILSMSRTIPVSAKGLAEIVAAAGQAGMGGDELLAFTEIAAKVGVAFGMTADETGENLAKIKTALGLTVDKTAELADVLNHLSNTSASSAPDLLNFMRRVGSAGKQYGFAARETAAIGSAMIAAGAQADVAGTSFRNLGKALAKGASATTRQRNAYKALGLDAVQVAKSLQENAVGTLNDVLSRIRQLPKEVQASTISQLFGDEARAIMPLIDNADLLSAALGEVADQTNYLGSAQDEYAVRIDTFDAKQQLFKNRLEEMSISIGSTLLPALTRLMEAVQPVISAIADLAAANPTATVTIVALAASLIGLRVAAIGVRYGMLFAKGGVLDLQAALLGGLSKAAAAGKASLLTLLSPLRLVKLAFRALRVAIIGTGIGAVLVGLAAAGTWIYNNWSGIADMFRAFGSAFLSAIEPITPALDPIISVITTIYDKVTSLLGPVQEGSIAWADLGTAAGQAIGDMLVQLTELPGKIAAFIGSIDFSGMVSRFAKAGTDAGTAIIDNIIAAFDRFWVWLSEIPNRIVDAIGNIDVSSMITWPSFPWSSGGGSSSTEVEARASGGPVKAGRPYLVGEQGAELIVPKAAATVLAADKTARLLAARRSHIEIPRSMAGQSRSMATGQSAAASGGMPGAGARPILIQFGDIYLPGNAGTDVEALKRAFGEEASAQIRSNFSDMF